jgi:Asp-tRNA(Asn)/Glu-tRNA(Gln) amidotransferase C subunit
MFIDSSKLCRADACQEMIAEEIAKQLTEMADMKLADEEKKVLQEHADDVMHAEAASLLEKIDALGVTVAVNSLEIKALKETVETQGKLIKKLFLKIPTKLPEYITTTTNKICIIDEQLRQTLCALEGVRTVIEAATNVCQDAHKINQLKIIVEQAVAEIRQRQAMIPSVH